MGWQSVEAKGKASRRSRSRLGGTGGLLLTLAVVLLLILMLARIA